MIPDSTKKIHFIGICGVAMSALAIAFKKQGYRVTGSDAGFFPPISIYLKNHDIHFYPGWHPEKMVNGGAPDLVVVGNVASSGNPEWMYAQEHKLNYKSYPEVAAEYIIKPNSIVCAGTYGKTTTSALLAWILTEAGRDPNYMFGGLAINGMNAATITDSDYSVVEGDEYKSARWDMRPKFAHYSPTHLILTSIIWDHADVYPTEEVYVEAFRDLLNSVSNNGLVVACTDNAIIRSLIANYKLPIFNYGASNEADYGYANIRQTKSGISFDLIHSDQTYRIESQMLGDYQAANITGAFAMASEIGIAPGKIIAAIKMFPGLKRRLEKRHEGAVTVFDDIAHSPAKAKATLATLRSIYAGNIIAIFEPNTGNRLRSSTAAYNDAFAVADEVIIPELTKVKHEKNEEPMNGKELAGVIAKTHPNAHYIRDDGALVSHVASMAKTGDVVVFLGSHGFRGMIEKLIQTLNPLPSPLFPPI